MIAVETALSQLFHLINPLGVEDVPLRQATGRVLARPVHAKRDQPPFASSVMDGYAVRSNDVASGAQLHVVAEAAAGHASTRRLDAGEAIRIFTGAPVPDGADRVLIQEDVQRDGSSIILGDSLDPAPYIRPAGADFRKGDALSAPRRLRPSDTVLAAAMNHPSLPCTKRPEVAIIATGDELVAPGDTQAADQIIASNSFGLAAMVEAEGAIARYLPIARDTVASLHSVFDLAEGADLIVTIGGASVGDHDLVQGAAHSRGMDLAFYKVAMRPGKPLMAGKLGETPVIGLPGNPVSAMVCGTIFVLPTLRAMMGLPAEPAPRQSAPLAIDVPANGPREHYMRAILEDGKITPFERQDSGLITVLAEANALLVRAAHAPASPKGAIVDYVAL